MKVRLKIGSANGGEKVVEMKSGVSCVKISADYSRMLTIDDKGLSLYDLSAVAQSGSLENNMVSVLPITKCASAYFVGGKPDSIVAASSTVVMRWNWDSVQNKWRGDQIYSGDNEVTDAEPDSEGKELIITEYVGRGDIHGILYSVPARTVWFDLGSDYKFFGATFAGDSDVVVSEHNVWKRAFPILPLSALVSLGNEALSPECQPPAPKEYRRSTCWPSSLQ